MENQYSKIGKLLGEWRRSHGFSLYKIAKDGPGNVRYDSLGRIEKGEIVSSETLLCYVEFCYQHGFRIFDEIYNNTSLQQDNVAKNTEASDTKEEVTVEIPAPPEEEAPVFDEEEDFDPSEVDEDYEFAEFSFDNNWCLNEQAQRAFIRHHRCPICGSELRQLHGTNGPFIRCSMFDNREDRCTYSASGTFEDFTISKSIVQPK